MNAFSNHLERLCLQHRCPAAPQGKTSDGRVRAQEGSGHLKIQCKRSWGAAGALCSCSWSRWGWGCYHCGPSLSSGSLRAHLEAPSGRPGSWAHFLPRETRGPVGMGCVCVCVCFPASEGESRKSPPSSKSPRQTVAGDGPRPLTFPRLGRGGTEISGKEASATAHAPHNEDYF